MLGVVPRELWQREHPPDEQNRIRLNLTCPLIIKGNDAILVDTGIGNRLSVGRAQNLRPRRGLAAGRVCARSGWNLATSRTFMLSHLHFDHCGGIVRRTGVGHVEPAFPRAQIFVQRGELEIARDSP